jgi:hypothetical protein
VLSDRGRGCHLKGKEVSNGRVGWVHDQKACSFAIPFSGSISGHDRVAIIACNMAITLHVIVAGCCPGQIFVGGAGGKSKFKDSKYNG